MNIKRLGVMFTAAMGIGVFLIGIILTGIAVIVGLIGLIILMIGAKIYAG